MMFIEPMIGFSQVSEKQKDFFRQPVQSAEKENAFRDIFFSAIEDVKTTETDLAQKEYLLSIGQLEDPHTLTIASSKAQASVDLLVNLRNKALDAYQEIMTVQEDWILRVRFWQSMPFILQDFHHRRKKSI